MSTSYLDTDGWYRRVPVQTLDELKEVQKICGSTSAYDQAFCKPVVNKIKHKRTVKHARPSMIALNKNGRQTKTTNHCFRERKFVKRITRGRATERKCDKQK